MLKRLLFLLAMLSPALAFAATPNITVNIVPGPKPTIKSIVFNNGNSTTYLSGATVGSTIAPISVKMSDNSTYTGTLSLSGTAASDFSVTNTALKVSSSTPTCASTTAYSFNIVGAPGSGEAGATVTLPATVSCSPSGQTIASIASPSSCTFTHGASSNCLASVTMSPASPAFNGSLSLVASGGSCSGTEDTTDFGVSSSPYAITFNGSAAAGTYATCLKATQGSSSAYKQVSITVGSTTSISCAYGPNYTGTIPAAAQAAGFTTCVLNFDFSSAAATTINNWLQCPENFTNDLANNGGQAWLMQTGTGGNSSNAPCSDFSIITDGTNGQVLDETFTNSDMNNNVQYTSIETADINTGLGIALPQNIYVDEVMRVPQSSYNGVANNVSTAQANGDGGCCVIAASFSDNLQQVSTWVEWDFIELAGTETDGYGNTFYWSGGPNSEGGNDFYSDWSGYNSTTYNTYSSLDTLSSGGDIGRCMWLNGVQNVNGCASASTGDGSIINITQSLKLWSGGLWPGFKSWPLQALTGNLDAYWKHVTVWSCSNWQATAGCARPAITSYPPGT